MKSEPTKIISLSSLVSNKKVSLNLTMNHYGHYIIPIPTVLLSNTPNTPNHTYATPPFHKLLEAVLQELEAKQEQAILHLGYFYDSEHTEYLKEIIQRYRGAISLLIADPVMGDHGRLYVPPSLISFWKQWVYQSLWAFPNLSELKILCGYEPDYEQGLEELIHKFKIQFPKTRLIVTGVRTASTVQVTCVSPSLTEDWVFQTQLPDQSGTGDLFTMAFIYYHCLEKRPIGESIVLSHNQAVNFLKSSI